MRIIPILLLLLTFTVSCASKEFNEPGIASVDHRSTRRSLRGSYTDVWNALLGGLAQNKYALARSDRQAGQIVTDWITGKSDRLFSGYGESRIPYNIRFRLTIGARPSRSGVEIAVQNEEQYYTDAVTAGIDFSGSLYQWIPTESSTVKEAAFLDDVTTILQNGGSKETK